MINDATERARLAERYFQWIDRAKADLMNVMISASNEIKRTSQNQFNDTLIEIWIDQRRIPEHERLSMGMLRLIEQRQKNIVDCLQSIYKFKSQFSLAIFHQSRQEAQQ